MMTDSLRLRRKYPSLSSLLLDVVNVISSRVFCLFSLYVIVCVQLHLFVAQGVGSYIHFCPRPCRSTSRWARLSTHRRQGTTLCVQSVLSCPLWPCSHRMCVIAKRLGCLCWHAHAPGHGYFLGASPRSKNVAILSRVSKNDPEDVCTKIRRLFGKSV